MQNCLIHQRNWFRSLSQSRKSVIVFTESSQDIYTLIGQIIQAFQNFLFVDLFCTTPIGRLVFLMKAWKESVLCLFPFWYSAVQLTLSQVNVRGSAHSYEPKPLRWSGREYSPYPPYPPTLVNIPWGMCPNSWGLVEIDTPALTKWVAVAFWEMRLRVNGYWVTLRFQMVIEGPQTGGKGYRTNLHVGFGARTSWRSHFSQVQWLQLVVAPKEVDRV